VLDFRKRRSIFGDFVAPRFLARTDGFAGGRWRGGKKITCRPIDLSRFTSQIEKLMSFLRTTPFESTAPAPVTQGRPYSFVISAVGGASVFFAGFALAQYLSFHFLADTEIVNARHALLSVLANACLAIVAILFVVANRWAAKVFADPHRVFNGSIHALTSVVLAAWLIHIHLAGTQNTLLVLLIPTTATAVMWLLDRFWAWFYWAAGTLGLFAIVALEAGHVLPYFPLAGPEFASTEFFHDSRVVLMNAVLYFMASITSLAFVANLHAALEKRTHDLLDAKAELEILASTDSLTGLLLRRAVAPKLNAEIARAAHTGHPLCAVVLDIDDFKQVNDTYGHAIGDLLLQEVASALRKSFRSYDLIARIGGEEFLVVLPENELTAGCELAERARVTLKEITVSTPEGAQVHVSASFGVAEHLPGDPSTVDGLIGRADKAHYEAKRAGKDRVCAAPAARRPVSLSAPTSA
jgi:diguanylate cyclase (GGDEF)-like protein